MKSKLLSLGARCAATIFVCVLGAAAHAQVSPVATAGVTLTPTGGISTPMSVAWVPAFSRYYGGSGGSTGSPVTVFSAAGAQLGQGSTGVDQRGIFFNPNTGFLESVSYSACCSAADPVRGVQEINLDGSGNLVGTNAQLLAAPIAALASSQTMPSYDSGADRLYAKQDASADVNVVNRTTGASAGTITLNLAAAGVTAGDVNTNGANFTGVAGSELAIYDFTNHRALVFDLAGNFIGASLLPAIAAGDNTDYGTGYANGQFFVFDNSAGAFGSWRGFVIFGAGPAATSTPVPTMSGPGIAALGAMLALLAMLALRRRWRA